MIMKTPQIWTLHEHSPDPTSLSEPESNTTTPPPHYQTNYWTHCTWNFMNYLLTPKVSFPKHATLKVFFRYVLAELMNYEKQLNFVLLYSLAKVKAEIALTT